MIGYRHSGRSVWQVLAPDRFLWSERDHVTVGELSEWFPRYLYLPRLKDRETILEAVRDGASVLLIEDTFATAEDYDDATGRYLGLRVGGGAPSAIDNRTCLVKVDVARKQVRTAQRRAVIIQTCCAPGPNC